MNSKGTNMKPGAVLTYELKPSDKSKVVRAVAITGSAGENTLHALNWSLLLAINNRDSVELNMQPGDGADGRTGLLVCRSEKNRAIQFSATTFVIYPARDFTVDELISTLAQNGKINYRFDSHFRGDRYWCMEIIRFLEEIGFLKQGCKDTMHTYIAYNSPGCSAPPIRGEFMRNVF